LRTPALAKHARNGEDVDPIAEGIDSRRISRRICSRALTSSLRVAATMLREVVRRTDKDLETVGPQETDKKVSKESQRLEKR
jgi:hypothetical protein